MATTAASTTMKTSPQNYRRILIAYDGSDNAKRALSRSVSIAEEQKAALVIVVVVPPSPFEEQVQSGGKLLGEAGNQARKVLSDVTEVLRDGQPADEILQLAEEKEVDLIVIGRRGISAVQRFFQGGVSSSVVTHSKCDVLVVR